MTPDWVACGHSIGWCRQGIFGISAVVSVNVVLVTHTSPVWDFSITNLSHLTISTHTELYINQLRLWYHFGILHLAQTLLTCIIAFKVSDFYKNFICIYIIIKYNWLVWFLAENSQNISNWNATAQPQIIWNGHLFSFYTENLPKHKQLSVSFSINS